MKNKGSGEKKEAGQKRSDPFSCVKNPEMSEGREDRGSGGQMEGWRCRIRQTCLL